jgi:hypothetical protein
MLFVMVVRIVHFCNLWQRRRDTGHISRSLIASITYWIWPAPVPSVNQVSSTFSLRLSKTVTEVTAGFSTSTASQIEDMLKIVASALDRVRLTTEKQMVQMGSDASRPVQSIGEQPMFREADYYHDGRIDCVAGNGVISELGLGDGPIEKVTISDRSRARVNPAPAVESRDPGSSVADSLPVVIIKNYASKSSRGREELLEALAKWAARLVDFKVFLFFPFP